jgi:hypothetical protein
LMKLKMVDNMQNTNHSYCYIPSSETFRLRLNLWVSPRHGERAKYSVTQMILLGNPSLLVCRLIRWEGKPRVMHNGQMGLDSRGEGNTSRVSVLTNTLCKFGGSELATPPSNYPCVVPVMRPGEIQTTGNLQENFWTDNIKMTEARYKDKWFVKNWLT